MFDLPKLDNLMTVKHYSILSAQKKKGTATTILLRSWRLICQPLPLFIQLVNLFCWVSLGSPETESRIHSRSPMVKFLCISWCTHHLFLGRQLYDILMKYNQTKSNNSTIQYSNSRSLNLFFLWGTGILSGSGWDCLVSSAHIHINPPFPSHHDLSTNESPRESSLTVLVWMMRSCIFLTFIFTRLQISLLYPKPSNVL